MSKTDRHKTTAQGINNLNRFSAQNESGYGELYYSMNAIHWETGSKLFCTLRWNEINLSKVK